MAQAIAFDTHRFVKNLTACGFTEAQAEVLAHEHVQLLDGNLATKTDIAMVKADLLKWMVAALTTQTGLIAGLIFGLGRLL